MTDKDPGLERLTNLTFAFLNAKELGRQFLTSAWVRKNVAGYTGSEKLFLRDRAVLQKVGVPIEEVADAVVENGVRVTGYRLQEDDYSLPEISFTPEEATVLGLAGERGMTGELSAFARSGWTKIAAAGATRTLGTAGSLGTSSDLNSIKAKTLDQVIGACTKGQALSFNYQVHSQASVQQRHLDPWGLVPLRGRMYLVGFDTDRGAVRSFRITRVDNITVGGKLQHPRPEGVDLQDIVEEALRRGQELISATVRIPLGAHPELEAQGIREGDVVRFSDVDKHWLLRECIAGAPEIVVLEPAELRGNVVAGLRRAQEVH
ncbi:helix-turn-helix transcriptional regulator [Corynebacterium sp. H130]|uniref:helix-turn-helix transcriptional regulator n=1 Tax=Corynebacterium sp. H130 TaxID=3133444 RepID=UPI0030B408E5